MPRNKVIYGDQVLIDLTSDTVNSGSLLSGKTAHDKAGNVITGSMADRGSVNQTLGAGSVYTIPAGYHNGNGKVSAKSLSSQTVADATASDINSGKTAWVNGSKITGTAKDFSTFWAKVEMTTGDCFGKTITIYKESVMQGTTVFDNTGHATFKANEPGTYTFSVTHAGQTLIKELTITEEGVYNLDLTTNLSYRDWLLAADLSTSGFSSLDDVLADEPTVRILMTKHAAVDYVVSKNNDTTNLTKIFNSGYAAKWINLRDYAFDTFEADSVISDIMDDVGKYGYGELVEVGTVPKMTSNTAPSGVVSASSEYSGDDYKAFHAFDNSSKGWSSNTSSNSWLAYKFTSPVKITKASLIPWYAVDSESGSRVKDFKIQASNDESSWIDLTDTLTYNYSKGTVYNIDINNNTSYLYYRIYVINGNGANNAIRYLQFYTDTIEGYEPKGNVPIMTSNTAPYGNCIGTEPRSDMPMWHAFDNNQNTFYFNNTGTAQVGYKFNNPIKIKRAYLYCPSNPTFGNTWPTSFNIQGSNDGNTWVTLYSVSNFTGGESSFDINNDAYYLQYRLYVTEYNVGTTACIHSLQFYGRELKALVPIMTSDTTPSGEAFGTNSSYRQNYQAFVPGAGWWSSGSATDGSQYIGYDFGKPMKIDGFGLTSYYGLGEETGFYKFKLQVSNDKVNWINTEYTIRTNIAVPSTRHYASVDLNAEYRYYRIVGIENSMSAVANNYRLSSLNFYGFDYSEHDECHWIYDHGVEVESVDLTGASSKGGDQLECSGTGSKIQTSSAINLASFSLLRMVLGNKYIAAANAEAFGVLDTQSSWPTYSAYARLDSQDKPNNLFLDISNITESKFIGFGPNNASGQISVAEWWLE